MRRSESNLRRRLHLMRLLSEEGCEECVAQMLKGQVGGGEELEEVGESGDGS